MVIVSGSDARVIIQKELDTHRTMTLEEAIAKIEELERSNAALLAKRDELLAEVKSVKAKYRDPLGDVDPTEAAQAYQRYKAGELVAKNMVEKEIETKVNAQSSEQIKELQKQMSDLRQSLEAEKKAKEKATLLGSFTSILAPQVVKPNQLLTILEVEGRIKLNESGQPIGIYKGEEMTPEEFVIKLREDADYQFHFKPTNTQGSGQNFSDGAGKKAVNPWIKASWNVTKQMQLLRENPAEAARLKSEAGIK